MEGRAGPNSGTMQICHYLFHSLAHQKYPLVSSRPHKAPVIVHVESSIYSSCPIGSKESEPQITFGRGQKSRQQGHDIGFVSKPPRPRIETHRPQERSCCALSTLFR
jgi:hypothetical protein